MRRHRSIVHTGYGDLLLPCITPTSPHQQSATQPTKTRTNRSLPPRRSLRLNPTPPLTYVPPQLPPTQTQNTTNLTTNHTTNPPTNHTTNITTNTQHINTNHDILNMDKQPDIPRLDPTNYGPWIVATRAAAHTINAIEHITSNPNPPQDETELATFHRNKNYLLGKLITSIPPDSQPYPHPHQ